MRASMIASTALAAAVAFAVPALAQQQGGQIQTETTTSAAQSGTPQGTTELIGADVIGQEGDDVGDLENVLVDDQGNATHVVIGHGGWMGLGEKEVAVPLSQIQVSGGRIQVMVPDQQLADMPEYEGADTTQRQQAGEAPTGQSQSPGQTPRQSNSVESPPGPSGATLETTPGVMPEPERPQAPND